MLSILSRGTTLYTAKSSRTSDGTDGYRCGESVELISVAQRAYVVIDVRGCSWMFGDNYEHFIEELEWDKQIQEDSTPPNFCFLAGFVKRNFPSGFRHSINERYGEIIFTDSNPDLDSDIQDSIKKVDQLIEDLEGATDADWVSFTRSFILENLYLEKSMSLPVYWLKKLVQQTESYELRLSQSILKGHR